ncbi:hypothetical protein [Halolamina sp. C58]|uniref:hypothetical protein n=1 Tax=Halolamina sp. C58 TaxID=3421640 RepID=UPI003EC12880
MNTHRAVSVLLAAVAATMLVTGSFGFTSVSADRGVAVNVVESEEAYVGVVACEKSNGGDNGTEPARVMVTNQFSEEFTIEDVSWDDLKDERTLQPGDSTTFNNAFADTSDGTVAIEVSGGLDATVTAQVKEKSDCPEKLQKNDRKRDKQKKQDEKDDKEKKQDEKDDKEKKQDEKNDEKKDED